MLKGTLAVITEVELRLVHLFVGQRAVEERLHHFLDAGRIDAGSGYVVELGLEELVPLAHGLELLEGDARAHRHAGERRVGQEGADLGLGLDAADRLVAAQRAEDAVVRIEGALVIARAELVADRLPDAVLLEKLLLIGMMSKGWATQHNVVAPQDYNGKQVAESLRKAVAA